jgi:hypothetical protein
MKRIILALIALTLLSSCSPLITKRQKERYLKDNCKAETTVKDSIRIIYNYTEKIDTIAIPEDSTFLRMYFACDEKNNVILRQLEEYKGKIFKTDIIYKDKILYVKTNTDEQKILTTNKEVVEEKYKEQKKDIVYEKRYIPKWVWYIWGASLILVWFRKPIFKFIFALSV